MKKKSKLTEEQRELVNHLYFDKGLTIVEVADVVGSTRSVVGRVVKEYKELSDNPNYVPYPKYYYQKNKMKIKINNLLNKIKNNQKEQLELLNKLNKTISTVKTITEPQILND